MVNLVYLSELLGKPIVDIDGAPVGRVSDVILAPTGEKFPQIDEVAFRAGGKLLKIPWGEVNRFDKRITLGIGKAAVSASHVKSTDILLAKDLLDKQIVDIDGLKVVRVNDVVLGEANNKFCVVSIDVGTRGLLRRLGMEWLSSRIGGREKLVPWALVEPLQSRVGKIKLNVSRHRLSDLHPADIASVMTELSQYERESVMKNLDSEKIAEILTKLDQRARVAFFSEMADSKAAEIFQKISPDEAADLLAVIAPERVTTIIGLMEDDVALNIMELLRYKDRSVGSIMTTDYFTVRPETRVRQAIALLRKRPDAKVFSHVFVADGQGRLKGAVSLRLLLLAKPSETMDRLLFSSSNKRIIKIHRHVNKAKAASLMAKYDLVTLPVVDSKGRLKGVVVADDAINAVLPPKVAIKIPHFFPEGGAR